MAPSLAGQGGSPLHSFTRRLREREYRSSLFKDSGAKGNSAGRYLRQIPSPLVICSTSAGIPSLRCLSTCQVYVRPGLPARFWKTWGAEWKAGISIFLRPAVSYMSANPRSLSFQFSGSIKQVEFRLCKTAPGTYASPRFSPDGKRLAFSMSGRSSQDIWLQDIWVQDLGTGAGSAPHIVAGDQRQPGLDAGRLQPDFPFRERRQRWILRGTCRR